MGEAGVKCAGIACEAIHPDDFNRQVAKTNNKASVNFATAMRLVDRIWRRWLVSGPDHPRVILDRHGRVKRARQRRRHKAMGTPLSRPAAPNELWGADFKGEFKLGNGRYCYPLTVTDHASRFLLLCEALECPVQPLQALGLVAPPRHRDRAHQAWQATAEWPARAYASHLEEGSHPAAGPQQPPAAGPLR